MYLNAARLILSPSDLSSFLGCRHRTGLELAAAHGVLERPEVDDPFLQSLADRGLEHERRYLEHLSQGKLQVANLSGLRGEAAEAATRDAMARGMDVIFQAALAGAVVDGRQWRGYADLLVRVERPSRLGAWSYEAHDTKLARETRGGTILQLSAYSALLHEMQGTWPEAFHVVTPAPADAMAPESARAVAARARAEASIPPLELLALIDAASAPASASAFRVERYRVADYAAYYRRVVGQLQAALDEGHESLVAGTYPEPSEACEICRWWTRCNTRRRKDDHLGFIAGIARTHRREFTANDTPTLAAAAGLAHPLPFHPTRGSRETFERLRDQARVQHRQRTSGRPVHERLEVQPGLGLARLPSPSPGDLFLDLEGAPYAREGGREYLFGLWSVQGYEHWWAFDDASERAAFEAVIDRITTQWTATPDMHVYHFAPYEPSALKRLMGRYAAKGDELDRLLRGERFVDLLAVVRQGLRAGVESYSIKQLEPFYGFTRDVRLGVAGEQRMVLELALESFAMDGVSAATRDAVLGYNRDDCRSTEQLRGWLERLRAEAIAEGATIERPAEKDTEPPKDVGELEARQLAMRAQLLAGLADEAAHAPGPGETAHPDHPRWLLAYLLDWHRREEKVAWWEHFRLAALAPDDLFDEPSGVGGLEFVERLDIVRNKKTQKPTGSVIDRYRYPLQETEVGTGGVKSPGGATFGEVVAADRAARTLDIKKGKTTAETHTPALFQSKVVTAPEQQASLLRLCAGVDEITCGTDLLNRRTPRLTSGTLDATSASVGVAGTAEGALESGEWMVDRARRLALALDRTTLAVQGPPGAGKTYLGAQMIRALVAAGKRVGVVASSHKVIGNLMDAVARQAAEAGETLRLGRRVGPGDDAEEAAADGIAVFEDNPEARAAIADGTVQVLGGTAWLWAREEFGPSDGGDGAAPRGPAVDVLFVDEAGQFSLANALAVSPAASSLVLLGDPQQLQQPQKGSHPDGVDVSALQHVIGPGAETMPPDRGLFLPVTWRLAPAVCAFTSEQFYEGRLTARAGLDRQRLQGTDGFDGAGLLWIPVDHDANRQWSAEEVEVVDALITRLLAPGATWITGEGQAEPLVASDVLVVAPYNAHVNRLADRLGPRGVRVGTVDKFQGQEAPVVIYATASSSASDAPRGMEFLYSRHRLNVATSRAKCAAFVVGSPRLLEPECRTPRQMALANALCRLVEMARQASRADVRLRPE